LGASIPLPSETPSPEFGAGPGPGELSSDAMAEPSMIAENVIKTSVEIHLFIVKPPLFNVFLTCHLQGVLLEDALH
jgi:hypothetical protein